MIKELARKSFKRLLHWVGGLLLFLLLIPLIGVSLFYLRPLQQQVVQWGVAQLAPYGYDVQVGRLAIRFPLRLRIDDVQVATGTDTLLRLSRLDTRLRLAPLREQRVVVPYLQLTGLTLHTDTLIDHLSIDGHVPSLRIDDIRYSWPDSTLRVARVALPQVSTSIVQTPADSSSTSSAGFPLHLQVGEAALGALDISYQLPAMRVGVQQGALAFTNLGITPSLCITLQDVRVDADTLTYTSQSADPSSLHLQFTALHTAVESFRYADTSLQGTLRTLSFYEQHGVQVRDARLALSRNADRWQLPYVQLHTDASHLEGSFSLSGQPDSLSWQTQTIASVGYKDVMAVATFLPSASTTFLKRHYPRETLHLRVEGSALPDSIHLPALQITLPGVVETSGTATLYHPTDSVHRRAWASLAGRVHDTELLYALMDTSLQRRIRLPQHLDYDTRLHYRPDSLQLRMDMLMPAGRVRAQAGYNPLRARYKARLRVDTLQVDALLPYEGVGLVALEAELTGQGTDPFSPHTHMAAAVRLDTLEWGGRAFTQGQVDATLADCRLQAAVSYADTLIDADVQAVAHYGRDRWTVSLDGDIRDLDLQGWGIVQEDWRSALRVHLDASSDSLGAYRLASRFYDMHIAAPKWIQRPKDLSLDVRLGTDTLELSAQTGDLKADVRARIMGYPWTWTLPERFTAEERSRFIPIMEATLSAGTDNPANGVLRYLGMTYDSLRLHVAQDEEVFTTRGLVTGFSTHEASVDSICLRADYRDTLLVGTVEARGAQASLPMMRGEGTAVASFSWPDTFHPADIQGHLQLFGLQFHLPAYSLHLHVPDSATLRYRDGRLHADAFPIYAAGDRPMHLDGTVDVMHPQGPRSHLTLSVPNVSLLQQRKHADSDLYGKAFVSGKVHVEGPFDALFVYGDLFLRNGSSLHYVYKDAALAMSNQLDELVTFSDFSLKDDATDADTLATSFQSGMNLNLQLNIDNAVDVEVLLGDDEKNAGTLRGGGDLNLQYGGANGLQLFGRYEVTSGDLRVNIPLLHVRSMTLNEGSYVAWSGNIANPALHVVAENRLRSSVNVDGSPQSVLFVPGIDLSGTLQQMNMLFTLSAPDNASMQNQLATLSSDERSKLALALLTTGVYLGEGGSGNLMNTALVSLVQSQIDNLSRDALGSIDFNLDISSMEEGGMGLNGKDYSFSLSKRFLNDRISVRIGGSLTTGRTDVEDNAFIDNIIVEWRLGRSGTQNLRFFYDKNYESVLEGEIREAGVGYVYRRRAHTFKELWP